MFELWSIIRTFYNLRTPLGLIYGMSSNLRSTYASRFDYAPSSDLRTLRDLTMVFNLIYEHFKVWLCSIIRSKLVKHYAVYVQWTRSQPISVH